VQFTAAVGGSCKLHALTEEDGRAPGRAQRRRSYYCQDVRALLAGRSADSAIPLHKRQRPAAVRPLRLQRIKRLWCHSLALYEELANYLRGAPHRARRRRLVRLSRPLALRRWAFRPPLPLENSKAAGLISFSGRPRPRRVQCTRAPRSGKVCLIAGNISKLALSSHGGAFVACGTSWLPNPLQNQPPARAALRRYIPSTAKILRGDADRQTVEPTGQDRYHAKPERQTSGTRPNAGSC
jgi:hypothetical protein